MSGKVILILIIFAVMICAIVVAFDFTDKGKQ